ncbi:MAG: hypothetical protein IKQ49_09320 [Eubacterium sp.]|nr:hypothetical protein [Eubacterium sp.]
MAEGHALINEILHSEKERMLYLKKYYPFFVLSETSLAQYKDGQYREMDMGYILMALLRYLIEENHYHGKMSRYEEIERFLSRLLKRDFPQCFTDGRTGGSFASLKMTEKTGTDGMSETPGLTGKDGVRTKAGSAEEEIKELARYLFDRIRNDGKPFIFPFYDPESHTRREGFVRLIEGRVQDGEVVYSITADGIEFYLSTKEMRDESTISTEQLLLSKMIRSRNFSGGIDVIRRINLEVGLLKKEREEVVRLLREDLPTGLARSRAYMERISKWFDQERKSFQQNKVLVDQAAARFSSPEIMTLETELKKTIESHRLLMEEAAGLSRMAGEMTERAKLKALRPAFDFREALRTLIREDRPEDMLRVIAPFLLPRKRRSFSIRSIDKLVNEVQLPEEEQEKRKALKPDLDFQYEDEKMSRVVGQNFAFLFRELLERILRWNTITLPELNAILETRFGKEVFRNRDYFSFLVHLAKKEEYILSESLSQPETFLEGYAAELFTEEEKERFRPIHFRILYGNEMVELPEENGIRGGRVRMMTFEDCRREGSP